MSKSKIDLEEVLILKELKHSQILSDLQCKISQLEKQNADLLYDNSLVKIYLKYGLTGKDSINQATGEIIIGINDDENTENEDKGTGGVSNG